MKLIYGIAVIVLFTIASYSKDCQTRKARQTPTAELAVMVDSFFLNVENSAAVYTFAPDKKTQARPLVFFLHEYTSERYEEYEHLLRFLAAQGNYVIYPPSRKLLFLRNNEERYDTFISHITDEIRNRAEDIDTSRIAFIGHSWGAGEVPFLMRRSRAGGWGDRGAAMYLMAPWYVSGISKRELQAFDTSVTLLVQIFDNDNTNDPQIAWDLYSQIGIPESQKEFKIVRSGRRGSCKITADNNTPLGNKSFFGTEDIFDSAAIMTTMKDFLAFSFWSDTSARKQVMGMGKPYETNLGYWEDGISLPTMISTDSPLPWFVDRPYVNRFNSRRNPSVDIRKTRKIRKVLGNYYKKTAALYADFFKTKSAFENEEARENRETENPLTEGFGAKGPFTMAIDSFPSPHNSMFSEDVQVYFFYPANKTKPSPLIINVHGYRAQNPAVILPFIQHIVSKGYCVIYPCYPFLPKADRPSEVREKYQYLYRGLEAGFARHSSKIDSTRIGIFGHSFGGGAAVSVAYQALVKRSWGAKGAFLFASAPWYSYDITPTQFQEFPSHLKFITMIYDDDRINDHQMAIHIFNSLPIKNTEKDFYIMYSDSEDGVEYHAGHHVPYGFEDMNGEMNNLDYFGIWKTFDALAAYAFTGNQKAKTVALGNGSKPQTFLGYWESGRVVRPMEVTDSPIARYDQLDFLAMWDHYLNPLR